MKVLVVPEDPTLDQYVLRPIVQQLFKDLGKPARVEVLMNPRMRGVAQALDPTVLAGIVETNRMIDLFLVLVDRDGDQTRQAAGERCAHAHPGRLLVCLAIEEIEVWMLALHREKLGASWADVRTEQSAKERFGEPFLREDAPRLSVGRGRKWAMQGLGPQWKGLLGVCPELATFREDIQKVC